MRNFTFLVLFLIFIVVLGGCIQTRVPVDVSPDKPEETPEPAGPPTTALEVYVQAQDQLVLAKDKIEAEEYEAAKTSLDKALKMTLGDFDRDADKDTTQKIESLLVEICINQIKLAHMRGLYMHPKITSNSMGLEYNPEVERWMAYYLTRGRRSMETYLARSGKYMPLMEKILKEKGLPQELKYLPLIESGYSPYAYSPAAASGLWQFISATGKRYGLQIDEWVDQRRDPEAATEAAADYLFDLHQMFDSWPLALASYNCGEGAVGRAIKRDGTRDYWSLSLPSETCNYVPKYYAAMLIAREPETYGFFVPKEDPLEYETIELENPADLKALANLTGVSYEELKAYNPELLSQYTHPKWGKYELNIPRTAHANFKKAFDAAPASAKYLSKEKIAKLKAPKHVGGKVVYYRVKKGDSLYRIARKYKTTVYMLKKYNHSARAKFLKPGAKLKIYPGRKK